MHLSSGRKDMAIWKWSDNGQYSAASTYHMLCEGSICFLCAKPIWRCWAPLSCKIFLWLALQYRIWTFDRRLQHGLQDQSFVCFLCDRSYSKLNLFDSNLCSSMVFFCDNMFTYQIGNTSNSSSKSSMDRFASATEHYIVSPVPQPNDHM